MVETLAQTGEQGSCREWRSANKLRPCGESERGISGNLVTLVTGSCLDSTTRATQALKPLTHPLYGVPKVQSKRQVASKQPNASYLQLQLRCISELRNIHPVPRTETRTFR